MDGVTHDPFIIFVADNCVKVGVVVKVDNANLKIHKLIVLIGNFNYLVDKLCVLGARGIGGLSRAGVAKI